MIKDNIEYPNNPRNGKALAGIVLLVVGSLLLFKQLNFFFFLEGWVLWPLWLIGWGLFIGARSNFRKPSALMLIIVGSVLLIGKNVPDGNGFIWPAFIIGFGLWMILRRNNQTDRAWEKSYSHKWDWRMHAGTTESTTEPVVDYTIPGTPPPTNPSGYPPSGDDYLDAVSVFGSVKKTILSKNFRGGEIVNIFGGAELDFTQADINGRVMIDITQIFGGTKLIVPPHWQVVSDIAAVFAGIDDKRMKMTAPTGSDKILVLKGVSIFAGVDIRSY